MPYELKEFAELINRYETPFYSKYRVYMKVGNVMYPVNNIRMEPARDGKPDTMILDSEIIESYIIGKHSV